MSLLHVTFDGETICAMRPEDPTKTFSSSDVPSGTASVIYKAAKISSKSHGKTLTTGLPTLTSAELATKISDRVDALTAVTPGEVIYDGTNDTMCTISTYDADLDALDQTKVLKPTAAEIQTKIDETRGFTETEAQNYADQENHVNLCSSLTAKSTGTCTISGVTLSDASADFVTDVVAANDIVVIGSDMAFVVDSTTDEITLSHAIAEGDYNVYTPMSLSDAMAAMRAKNNDGDTIDDLTDNEADTALTVASKTALATQQVNVVVDGCLEVPTLYTELESGNCTTSTTTLTDGTADFVTAGVAEDDLVKVDGGMYKVASVTSATVLELKVAPAPELAEATSYSVLNSAFMAQFEYIKSA